MGGTNDFSVNACYAVLSAYPEEEPLYAILKMVVAVVEEQKYAELDPQIISKEFHEKFHFKDRSESFKELFDDMVRLGMNPRIFQHTYDEIAGIIDTARAWINILS